MAKINDLFTSFKAKLKNSITTESSAEEIKRIDDLCTDIDSIEQEANLNLKENAEIKDMYIKAVKNQGSTEAPKEDHGENPRSLEDIANAEIEKSKDK